ncbi:hypothetical protein F2P81_022662 [Scophthalmus maximus]|uniref:Uncharacterized protein n=1 Tax=Scophthalmus maximus TaxID=52904 RepID=A0A6A4S3M6_SCOMX|nr:hypothetical protein F2P81_022662 [Scophthalmus maximus]
MFHCVDLIKTVEKLEKCAFAQFFHFVVQFIKTVWHHDTRQINLYVTVYPGAVEPGESGLGCRFLEASSVLVAPDSTPLENQVVDIIVLNPHSFSLSAPPGSGAATSKSNSPSSVFISTLQADTGVCTAPVTQHQQLFKH